MKYIIELPEDYYKAIKEIPIKQSTTDMLIIRNGTPLSEELEKIKAEIIENQCITCGLTCIPYGDCKYYECIEVKEVIECLELIENHIAELKGGAE